MLNVKGIGVTFSPSTSYKDHVDNLGRKAINLLGFTNRSIHGISSSVVLGDALLILWPSAPGVYLFYYLTFLPIGSY